MFRIPPLSRIHALSLNGLSLTIRRRARLPLILAATALVLIGAAYVGFDRTLQWLLLKDAEAIGMNWAHHMEVHMPGLVEIAGSGTPSSDVQPRDPVDLAMFAYDILSVDNIHQIDFVDASGQCVASFGSYLTPLPLSTVQAWTSNARQTDGPVNTVRPAPTPTSGGRLQDHLIADDGHHGTVSSEPGARWRLPLDHALILPFIDSGRQEIIIRRDSPAHQPSVFAEIYYPIRSDGELIYLLRILVNLEARQALYRNLLIVGSLVLLALAALSFVYPARKFLQIRKGKNEADERARFLATHDMMTGLANRNAFQEQAVRLLADCRSSREDCVLLLIDIDGFKHINDFYGHDAGDQLLKQVARRLERRCPDDSLIARIGGDEFAVIARSSAIATGSEAERLDVSGSFEIKLNQRIQNLTVSIVVGMARFPRDGKDLQELMLNADLAWYSAKRAHDGRFCEFDAHLRQQFQGRINLLRDFAVALENGQIVPHYQPLICAATGRVSGLEALARWRHPTRDVLTPAFFHEALEDREIAQALGTRMLGAITADMAIWKRQGVPFERVGFNVTDADLLRPGFSLDVIAELSRHGLSGHELTIEITENCVFGGNKAAIAARLEELRTAGCKVALDDFGTGYSSITHIKDIPVSAVKIDKSFIREIVKDQADQAIVRALVDLGASIGFRLVAEGVENKEQCDLVRSLGCHLIQGFYYAKPVPAQQVPQLIARLNPAPSRAAG